MNAFPEQMTPGRLFYRGLVFGLAATACLWAALAAVLYTVT